MTVGLTLSLAAFAVAAVLGLLNACHLFRGRPEDTVLTFMHVASAVVGAVAAIFAFLAGAQPVVVNIALVLVIAALGFFAYRRRRETGLVQRPLILLHAAIAVACYLLLAYNTAKILGLA